MHDVDMYMFRFKPVVVMCMCWLLGDEKMYKHLWVILFTRDLLGFHKVDSSQIKSIIL